jgi:outer membrane murein-binding lipoprotein Lpp
MDQELREYLESMQAETQRHFEAVKEHIQDKIALVAEGVLGTNERIDRLDTKVDRLETKVDHLDAKVDHLETKVDRLETKVDHLADEMKNGFADVRAMITLSHTQLDTRVRKLEQH